MNTMHFKDSKETIPDEISWRQRQIRVKPWKQKAQNTNEWKLLGKAMLQPGRRRRRKYSIIARSRRVKSGTRLENIFFHKTISVQSFWRFCLMAWPWINSISGLAYGSIDGVKFSGEVVKKLCNQFKLSVKLVSKPSLVIRVITCGIEPYCAPRK